MWLKMLIVSVLSTMEGFFAVVVVTDVVLPKACQQTADPLHDPFQNSPHT